MTDHPRFEPIRNTPDQAHLSYNGGRLVNSVLNLVDWWRAMHRSPRAWRLYDPADGEGTVGRPTSLRIKGGVDN
jgi:hypothetical protein